MTLVISAVNHFFDYESNVAKDELRKTVARNVVALLHEERERRGISMNVLAQRCGISQSTVSLIERGLRIPNLDTLLRIAEVLEVNLGKVIAKAIEQTIETKRE
jgi:transcriptional regulator with XRE-family HTH domain